MKPTSRLTFDDAVQVWLRYWHGDKQHDIAAAYGVNSARVSDVVKRRFHLGSERAAQALLETV